MARRKSSKTKAEKRKPSTRKLRVAKFSPDAEGARDEGPRLIPLPDNSPVIRQAADPGGLPTNRYIALADLALRLWNPPEPAGETEKPELPSPPRLHRC